MATPASFIASACGMVRAENRRTGSRSCRSGSFGRSARNPMMMSSLTSAGVHDLLGGKTQRRANLDRGATYVAVNLPGCRISRR